MKDEAPNGLNLQLFFKSWGIHKAVTPTSIKQEHYWPQTGVRKSMNLHDLLMLILMLSPGILLSIIIMGTFAFGG